MIPEGSTTTPPASNPVIAAWRSQQKRELRNQLAQNAPPVPERLLDVMLLAASRETRSTADGFAMLNKIAMLTAQWNYAYADAMLSVGGL